MRTAVFTATLFLLTGNVLAEPEEWMVKENPDELMVLAFSTISCPVSGEIAYSTVEGVLTRSRIKAIPFTEASPEAEFPWLLVFLGCGDDRVLCSADVDFLGQEINGFRFRYGIVGYGVHGYCDNDPDRLLDQLRDGVESAITDYLQANFDL